MKKYLLLLAICIPVFLSAQNEPRYLAGAIPLEDGKVVFTKEISVPGLTQDQLFEKLLSWAQTRYNSKESRVAFSDKAKGDIAVMALDTLVFSRSALSLDQSEISYRVIMACEGDRCTLKFSNIRYEYNVSYKREPEKYVAEELITDKYALSKNKLNRLNGKFRRETINLVDETFEDAEKALGINTAAAPIAQAQTSVAVQPTVESRVEVTSPVTVSTKEGYMAFTPDKVPQSIVALLAESPARLTPAGKEDLKETNITWKGLSTMFGKTVATLSLSAESQAYKQTDGVYTVSFLKEPTDETPWMIIECRKQGETTEGSQKTIIGEVLHVWIK